MRTCATSPSIVTFFPPWYTAAWEWCANTRMPETITRVTTRTISTVRFMNLLLEASPLSGWAARRGFQSLTDIAIHGLDEHRRCPGGVRVHSIEIQCRLSRRHLVERHFLLCQVQNPIANDRHEVAVIINVGFVAQPAMARDHSRTALLIELGNREIQNPVQCVEHALDVAASLRVNDRITVGDEQISGADHIRPAEEHHQVAVCMSTRLVEDLNWFAVEKQLFLLGEKRRRGQSIVRRRRLASGRAIHPVERGFMRDDADCGIVVAASAATASAASTASALPRRSDGGFRFLDGCISAGM